MSLAELVAKFMSFNFDEYLIGRNFEESWKNILKAYFNFLKIQLTTVEKRFGGLLSESIPEPQELFQKHNLLDAAIIGSSNSSELLTIFAQISTICDSISKCEIHKALVTIGSKTIRKV